ncbi:MAG: hypothetical protein HY606_15370 [Planctomycetes bacterium]|nr:hypothetical protein [Planctomycetota bacterium]
MKYFFLIAIIIFCVSMEDEDSWSQVSAPMISLSNQMNILDDLFAISFREGISEGVSAIPINGGFALVGNTMNAGDQDIWVVKTDVFGSTLWEKRFNFGISDKCTMASSTSDGGLIICANTQINYTHHDALIIKLGSNGSVQWSYQIDTPNNEYIYSIKQTSDGGYIAAGYTAYGAFTHQTWVIKLDSTGSVVWENSYRLGYLSEAKMIRETFYYGTGYIIIGPTLATGTSQSDIFLLKLDGAGNTVWCNLYGSAASNDVGYSVVESIYGGYAMAWHSWSPSGFESMISHVDSTGNFSRPPLDFNMAIQGNNFLLTTIDKTSDGGYITSGAHGFAQTFTNIAAVKFNPLGAIQWQKYYYGTAACSSGSLKEVNSGYLIGGTYNTLEMWELQIGRNGEIPFNNLAKTGNTTGFAVSRPLTITAYNPLSFPASHNQTLVTLTVTATNSRKTRQAP